MSSKKIDRALYGPSWSEVIIGAALSFVLGAVLAAAVLILRPVQTVRELPKEPAHDTVYYIEGSKDSTKGRQWLRKRQMLDEGASVTLSEDELNAAFASSASQNKPPPVPADKGKAAAAPAPATAASEGLIVPGNPNFRIHDNQLQVGVPCTLNVYGFKLSVILKATGGFARNGDSIDFVPETFYLGSIAVSRLPMLEGFVTRRILAAQSPPADLMAAWKKLSDITIEGNTLKLTM